MSAVLEPCMGAAGGDLPGADAAAVCGYWADVIEPCMGAAGADLTGADVAAVCVCVYWADVGSVRAVYGCRRWRPQLFVGVRPMS